VQNTARRSKITVSADGKGLVSRAGAVLLAEAARVTGLGEGLSGGLARWRAPRAVHDPGKIIADLVVTLALGGDCLADIAVLRAQPELAGPVASGPVVSRLISVLAADAPRALKRSARRALPPASVPAAIPDRAGQRGRRGPADAGPRVGACVD
jgi:Transposase DDE domain group 1